jgi:hypothetical protein
LRLRFGNQTPDLLQRLQALAGVREVRALNAGGTVGGTLVNAAESAPKTVGEQTGVDVYADRGGSLIPEIASLAASSGAELSDVHISEPSLENLFLHHTGRSLRD